MRGLAREVLAYFLQHPEAADSLEGIVKWRLKEQAIHRGVEEVSRAIGWLLDRELLVVERVAGSTAVFHLNDARVAEVERLVGEKRAAHKRDRRISGRQGKGRKAP